MHYTMYCLCLWFVYCVLRVDVYWARILALYGPFPPASTLTVRSRNVDITSFYDVTTDNKSIVIGHQKSVIIMTSLIFWLITKIFCLSVFRYLLYTVCTRNVAKIVFITSPKTKNPLLLVTKNVLLY